MSAAKIKSEETESIRPPEILCQILRFAIRPDGVKALLPLAHVSARWRRAALGDSSLWTTIHLKHTTAPLFDMILAHAGNQLFTVYVDHHAFDRLAKLWELFDRVEELHYTHDGIEDLTPFIASLGPAPNLKALHLQPGLATGPILATTKLPVIFSGCSPSLRTVTLSNTIGWPFGLFRDLVSFECGASENSSISVEHVLDAIRESPSIEFIRLVGFCEDLEGLDLAAVNLPSLVKCSLGGDGTTSLIRFIIAPATALVSLNKSRSGEEAVFPKFNDCSVTPGIHLLGNVSAIALSIDDDAARLQANNDRGGVLDAKVDGLYGLSRDPLEFILFIWSSFHCWRACPGFEATKKFTLSIERGRVWQRGEADAFSFDLIGFILDLPSVEEVNLQGVPPQELYNILLLLSGPVRVESPCPNLKRLQVESTPLRSPRSLLVVLGKFLAGRKGLRTPLQSITVKVRCEVLIPATEHCALLAAWKGVVGGGVRLEYERTEVNRMPGCRRYDCGCGGKDDRGGGDGPGDHCVGWDGWPEKWPETMENRRDGKQSPRKVESPSIPLLRPPQPTPLLRDLPSASYLCNGGEMQEFAVGSPRGPLSPPTMPVVETKSHETESARPPGILGQILRFAVGSEGVKALLPLTHVSTRWRRTALGDSSLWTTIYLRQTTTPLLDMILAHAGGQLFTVYVDHHDVDRLAKLWELFGRVQELHYTRGGIEELTSFITSLGPAPNLRALYLQPRLPTTRGQVSALAELPTIFSGCLPSLRRIKFSNTISWPLGLFGGLVSFEYGFSEHLPISASHVLDVLRYSPSLEFLRLVGFCALPERRDPRAFDFPSLTKCTLVGDGTTTLIQYLLLPTTALVSLSKSDTSDETGIFPKFHNRSVAPALRAHGEVSTISISINDHAVGIRAKNCHGGVVDAKVEGLYDRLGDPPTFTRFMRRSFDSWLVCPGFCATKELTLSVERGRTWEPKEAIDFAMNVSAFFFNLPRIEEITLLGVPPRELSLIFDSLCSLPQPGGPCRNLKRLRIESALTRSPRSLLACFSICLVRRKQEGLPFNSVAVKVKCETIIPATEHCDILASWERLVGEDVKLEYERAVVEKLSRCPSCGRGGDEDEGGGIDGSCDCCVGWDGWPEKWPKTMGEMSGQRAEST